MNFATTGFFESMPEYEYYHSGKIPPCGTTACLAGHAVILWGLTLPRYNDIFYTVDTTVKEFLGLTDDESYFLFRKTLIVQLMKEESNDRIRVADE